MKSYLKSIVTIYLKMDVLIETLTKKAEANSRIGDHWFREHNIKRGLRNEDGTGVKAILTEISDVTGYERVDGGVVPVEGRLVYRGIEINDLVNGFLSEGRYGFEETAYLLMFGETPNQAELSEFSQALTDQRKLPDGFVNGIILAFPDNDIMNKLMTTVTVLGREDSRVMDTSTGNVIRQCTSLIAKFPTIVAYAYQAKKSQDGGSLFIHPPNGSKSAAENFLYMLREDKQYTSLEAQVLDMMLVLHADHSGGNNSTFTNHVVTSTLTDTYSAMVAALASLKGPLHGGASMKVMEMVDDLKAHITDWENEGQITDYLTRILTKEAFDHEGKIWGMGHAVYTLSDPRAVLLRGKSEELAAAKGRSEEFRLYEAVARITKEVMSRQKGREVAIAPNVDYYSGFVYGCMGFPRDIYTSLFAMARIAGWSAHRIEELINGKKIIRPASVYVGPRNIGFVPLAKRV